jgi:hypothetical protein
MVGYFQIMLGYLVVRAHYWRCETGWPENPEPSARRSQLIQIINRVNSFDDLN